MQDHSIIITCKQCGKSFKVSPSRSNRQYCGKECYHQSQFAAEERTCPVCEKKFEALPHQPNVYCSNNCRGVASRKPCQPFTCRQCKKIFSVPPWEAKTNPQFCNHTCRNNWYAAQEKTPIPHTCQQCGKEFMARKSANRQFCSRTCCNDAQRLHPICKQNPRHIPKTDEERNCLYCNQIFMCRPYKKNKFCSKRCVGMYQRHRTLCICEICGKEFERKSHRSGRFCSHDCVIKGVNAKRNPSIWVTKTCPYCGKEFTHRQEKKDRIFCSASCSTRYHRQSSARKQPRITVQCEYCGKLKEIRSKDLKKFRFCSIPCRRAWVLQNMPRISSIERKMADAFTNANMYPETQYVVNSFSIDFAFVDQKLAVECDGDYWHNLPQRKIKDRQKDGCLRKHGWHVLRLWEHEINESPIDCVNRVQTKLLELTS